MHMSSEWQPPSEWSEEQPQKMSTTGAAIAADVEVSQAANAIVASNEDHMSVSNAFSAAINESPLLRRYDVARARAYDQEYRKWYAAIEVYRRQPTCTGTCGSRSALLFLDLHASTAPQVDEARNARLTAAERDAHDRQVAAKVAADAERTRARVAALERAVGQARAVARGAVSLLAAQVELRAAERERAAARAAKRPRRREETEP